MTEQELINPKPTVLEILEAGRILEGEGDHVTWVSVSVFEEKARALVGLAKGTEVYAEGHLSLNAWTGRDGAERTGLSVTAWRIEVLGQIGADPGGRRLDASARKRTRSMTRSHSDGEGHEHPPSDR